MDGEEQPESRGVLVVDWTDWTKDGQAGWHGCWGGPESEKERRLGEQGVGCGLAAGVEVLEASGPTAGERSAAHASASSPAQDSDKPRLRWERARW